MLHTSARELLQAEAAKGNALSRRLAALILMDCARADWEELDFEELLEAVYRDKGPAVAVEVWSILKQIIKSSSGSNVIPINKHVAA